MRTSATNRKLRILLTAISSGALLPRPDFQRRLVWTNKDKLAFVQTVLEGFPFPEIYIASGDVNPNTGEGMEMLVDGQQRITTLNQYFRGSSELRLDKSTPSYNSLTDDRKRDFLEYEVVVRDLGQMPLEEIKRVFQRINATNYSLNAMEIHNSRFDGEFKKSAEWLSLCDFFEQHGIFSAADVRRMQDVRFCLTLMVTVMSTYFNRDEPLEEYLEKYNDEFDQAEELKKEFLSTIKLIDDAAFSSDSRVWKKADLFTLITEVHRALFKKKLQLNPKNVADNLTSFYKSVDSTSPEAEPKTDVSKYYKAALQGSNDRSNRITRGEIIEKLLTTSFTQQNII